MAFGFKQSVITRVVYTLIVPIGAAQRAFVFHAAFLHYFAGVRIVRVVAGFDAVETGDVEEEIRHGFQRLGHYAFVPPFSTEAIPYMRHRRLFVIVYDRYASDRLVAVVFQYDCPLIKFIVGI